MEITTSRSLTAVPKQIHSAYIQAFIKNQNTFNTRRDYKQEVNLFYRSVGKNMEQVTLHDLISYKEQLESRGLKPASIAKKLTVLRRLFTFFYEQGVLPTNPSAGLKLPKVKNETTRTILSLAECNRLLSSIGASTVMGLRDRAILALLCINALRICEISRANVGDIIQNDGCVALRVHGKGGREDETRLREDVLNAINAYLNARGEVKADEPLFVGSTHRKGERISTRTIQHFVKKYMKKIGINRPTVVTHSLRHSAISALIEAGVSLLDTQTFARHSSSVVTQRYIHQKDKMKNHAVLRNPITMLPLE